MPVVSWGLERAPIRGWGRRPDCENAAPGYFDLVINKPTKQSVMNAKQDSSKPTQRERIAVRFFEAPVDRFEPVVTIQNEYVRESRACSKT